MILIPFDVSDVDRHAGSASNAMRKARNPILLLPHTVLKITCAADADRREAAASGHHHSACPSASKATMADATPTFVFFYGSCISSESRARTGLSGLCLPCTVSGFVRTWSASIDLTKHSAMLVNTKVTGITAVSAQASAGGVCNGVIVQIDPSELPRFDEREAGYDQRSLPASAIKLLRPEQDAASFPVETAQL